MKPTAEQALICKVRDEIIEIKELHRSICADPDCPEPLNTMALLLHSVGVRVEDLARLKWYLADYEAHCENCSHLRN